MALINCNECGKEISTGADACPHCGYKQPKKSIWPVVFAWIFVLIGAPIAAALIFGDHNKAERDAQAKAVCVKALLDGARVTSYVDKQAYDKVVADKCAGFSIPK